MNLILWRHAEAKDGAPDLARELTDKGRKQALQMAKWLGPRLPKEVRILVSPAVRSRQTADALHMDYEVLEGLAPGADAAQLLTAAGWPETTETVVVVGHQPTLGRVASLLAIGEEGELTIKKGAIFWIARRVRDGGTQNVLRAVLSPDLLRE
jgi:phosphohistidine phosphatase